MRNSTELTDAVYERIKDKPSHAIVTLHEIVKHVIAVLDEWDFLIQVPVTEGGDDEG